MAGRRGRARRPGWLALVWLLGGGLAGSMVMVFGYTLLGRAFDALDRPGARTLGMAYAVQIGFGAAAWRVYGGYGGTGRTLGLRGRDFRRWRGAAVRYETAALLFVPAILFLTHLATGWSPEEDGVLDFDRLRGGWPGAAAFLLLPVVVAPAAEELVFRGLVRDVVASRCGTRAGAVASALLFGLAHGALRAPAMFAYGLWLARIRRRTRSLAAPVMVHVLHNGLVMAAAMAHWAIGGRGGAG